MQKEEEIQIPGYSLLYRNDRSANNGRILIEVKDNIKNISLKLTQEWWAKVFRSKSQTQRKNRADVIYTQQENLKPNNGSKILYEDITEQIKIGIEGKQQILIFNAKIAATIEGNKTKVTKGWAQLLKLGNKGNMITLNIVKAKCKGVWK